MTKIIAGHLQLISEEVGTGRELELDAPAASEQRPTQTTSAQHTELRGGHRAEAPAEARHVPPKREQEQGSLATPKTWGRMCQQLADTDPPRG